MNHQSLSLIKRSTRKGTVGFIIGAVLLAVLVLVNLLVGLLPAKVTVFDTSGIGLTEISGETSKFVSGMKEDVTVYWLCTDGIVDEQFELLLTRYEEAGKHVKVEVIDTTENPTFAAAYTEASLANYSLIIESGRRATVVDRADMYYYTNYLFPIVVQLYSQYFPASITEPMTFQELSSFCSQYGTIISMIMAENGMKVDDVTAYNAYHSFCGEAKLTAALDYVTREYIPHAYLLTGHGESAPSESLAELMSTMGMHVEKLDLKVAQAVPVDANCLILFSPADDLSTHEADLIADYLNAGGSMMLNTSPEVAASCPNIQRVCGLFGLSAAPGVVEEGDTSFISGSRFTLVPTASTEHIATAYISQGGYKPQMPNSHAITSAPTLPTGVSVTPLFTTSETANRVSLADPSQTLGTAGKLHVAVAATRSVSRADGTADTANLAWFGSAEALTDTVSTKTSGGNYYYYTATISSMSEPFISAYENLSAVPLSGESLTGLTDGAVFLLGAVVVLILPAALLTTGIVIWVRRKRR